MSKREGRNMSPKRTKNLKWVALCLLVVMLSGIAVPQTALAKYGVTRGTVDYTINMKDAYGVFIGNKKTLGTKVGMEYFMTYTVESIGSKSHRNQGILGTNVPKTLYPYEKVGEGKGGLMQFNVDDVKSNMLQEGRTYFIKFTITKDGYDYQVGWAKDEVSNYVKLKDTYGEIKTNLGYFGIWLDDEKMTGKLTKIRCYDRNGNDLGVQFTNTNGDVTLSKEIPFRKDREIEHTYDLSIVDAVTLAISNKIKPTSNKIYMQYTVKSSAPRIYQEGVILSNTPRAGYPYEEGYMMYNEREHAFEGLDAGPLLVEGAEYIIIFEKLEDELLVTVQRTVNGETEYLDFVAKYGKYDKEQSYYSIWFCQGKDSKINAELVDFKCYDSNGNNLSVQVNSGECDITHHGEMEDYAGSEAMYANQDKGELFALYKDKALKYTASDVTKEGSFRIENDILTTDIEGQTTDYDYLYQHFTAKDGTVYNRLADCKMIFETGEGSPVEEIALNAENGYTPLRPTDPVLEDNTFEGWYTIDGEEYKFDKIQTESITLYAKWEKIEYADVELQGTNVWMYAGIGAGVLVLAGAAVTCIVVVQRRKKNADNNK